MESDEIRSDEQLKPERLRNNLNGSPESLCAYCGNACNSGCSWSESFTPVEGWTAAENDKGYFVIECPEFKHDDEFHMHPDDMDTEGCIKLLEAFIRVMREDYSIAPRQRRSIERFIRDPRHVHLFWFCDPNDIIEQFRKGMRHTI